MTSKIRVLILGANGMLGHQLCGILSERMEVWGSYKAELDQYGDIFYLPQDHAIANVQAQDSITIQKLLEKIKPEVVVNGIGIVKQRDEAKQAVASIEINALFPHHLGDLCLAHDIRLIHISTDCVFSGLRGNYSELDIPDPVDLYGRSKLLGELNRPGCLTLRTSIIGWQLDKFGSLLSWLALQRGSRIKGYRKAIYSGFSTVVMAQLIGDIIESRPDLTGLYQVASEPISKFDLLLQLRDLLGWEDLEIQADDQFFCDRSLSGSRFSNATGWQPPSWKAMLQGLAEEWPRYRDRYSKAL